MARGFFGRETERATVLGHLAAGERALILTGAPGVGKTTLARVVAADLEGAGSDVRAVSLDHARDRAGVLASIARATGVTARSADPRVLLERIVERVDGTRVVLLLDGLDQAMQATAEIAADLLDATTGVALVVACRERLGTALEVVVALTPLDTAAAVEMLLDRTRRIARSRRVEPLLAEELARRAGCLPLALEIVAARVATLGAQAVLAALEEGHLEIDALDRALDASWGQLAQEERAALAALGVFRGTFTLEAARAVLGSANLGAVDALARASLLDSVDVDAGDGRSGDDPANHATVRFGMLDGVRTYATRRARELGIAEHAAARHSMHYALTALPRSDDASSWARLVTDRHDLLAAWEHARTHDVAAAARLASTLDPLLVTQGPSALHRRVLEETLVAVHDAGPNDDLAELEIDLRLALGRTFGLRGLHASALPHFEAALAVAERTNDASRAAWSAAFLCFSLRPLARFEEARAHGARAIAAARALRDPRLEAMSEQAVGCVELAAGAPRAALVSYRRALAAARVGRAPRLEGIALANLALAYRDTRDLDEALRCNTESAAAFEQAADRFHLARIAVDRGNILVERGQLDEGEAALAVALDAVVEQGDIEGETDARVGLARVAEARGDMRLWQRRYDDLEAVARLGDDVVLRDRIAGVRASVELHSAGSAARAAPLSTPAVRASHDGRVLELFGRRIDLSRRGPLRRLVVALVDRCVREPGAALSVGDMLSAGWPGERMRADSGSAHVYMAIRRLRLLGLEPVLRTSDEGYSLDAEAGVSWLEGRGDAGGDG